MSLEHIHTTHGNLPLWPNIHRTDGLKVRAEVAGRHPPEWTKDLLYSEVSKHPKYQAATPPDVLAAVRRFRCCHLPLLGKAEENPERFLALADQSPALVFALAYSGWTSERKISLDPSPHRILWSALGWPSTNSFARVMARIPAHLIDPYTVPTLAIRWSNCSKFRRLFRHASTLNHAVIQCLLTVEEQVLDSWCLQIAESDRAADGRTAALIRMLRAHWTLVHPGLPMDYRSVSDRTGLERALYKLQCELASDAFFVREEYTAIFPDPPCSMKETGTDYADIVPLRHPLHLEKEGQLQSNCALQYLRAVYARRAYLFSCRSRRLTILVERAESGSWYLSSVVGPANTAPSEKDLMHVKDWFQRLNWDSAAG